MKFLIALLTLTAACTNQVPLSQTRDAFAGAAFYYYDHADRQDVAAQLRKAMTDNYSLREIKQRRLGVDTAALFEAFEAGEAAIPDVSEPEAQAAANLAFIDRARQVIAQYQDTHLSVGGLVSAPVILNGLELREVEGRFYVVSLQPKVVAFAAAASSAPDLYTQIALGDEVTSIDGRPVSALVEEMASYEGASSADFRRLIATKRLTVRNYAFPEKPYADYQFVSHGDSPASFSVRLPYFVQEGEAVRADAHYLLAKRGFLPLKNMKATWNEERRSWDFGGALPSNGFDKWSQVPAGLVDIQEWHDLDFGSGLALRTGYVFKGGKAYGVAQIYSFMVGALKNTETNETMAFEAALTTFVSSLKANQIPLIIDLRNNGGGRTNLPATVLSAIASTGAAYPSFTEAFRVTRPIRQMLETYSPPLLGTAGFDPERIAFEQLEAAVSGGKSHTDAIDYTSQISSSIGGYDQPVVAMITPNCISSCDITSILMKASHRVTLLGTHANGTGAGMRREAPFTGATWTDSFDILTANIPNFLFGYPGAPGELVHEGDKAFELNSENVPVAADVQYDYTLDDMFAGSKGWIAKAIAIIDAQS